VHYCRHFGKSLEWRGLASCHNAAPSRLCATVDTHLRQMSPPTLLALTDGIVPLFVFGIRVLCGNQNVVEPQLVLQTIM
jgi:hypothetical protein